MFPLPPKPKHLLTPEEASTVTTLYQHAGWQAALSKIISLTHVTAQRALEELSALVGLGSQGKTTITDDPKWTQLVQQGQTPLWHSWLLFGLLVAVGIIGGITLAFDTFYRWLIPLLSALLMARWAWLTDRGHVHARVVIGGILLVVQSGLVAAALMDENSDRIPASALPLILWCLTAMGGGLAFSVWGAVAPKGSDRADQIGSARIAWRIGLVNLALTVLISALVPYYIGLNGGPNGTEAFNTLFRLMIFMIVYAAFSAYLLAPLARNAVQASLALAVPIAIGLLKWSYGPQGEALAYLLLLCCIQFAAVGFAALGLLALAIASIPGGAKDGQLVAAAIAFAVAAIGWGIIRFLVNHGVATGAFTDTPSTWLWIGLPSLITATSATIAAYQSEPNRSNH